MTSSVKNNDVVEIDCDLEVRREFSALYELETNKDYSESQFSLARNCIVSNPCSYTAWKVYFNILEKIGWRQDEQVEEVMDDTPKNYQLWNFRRMAYNKQITPALEELDNTDVAIRRDNKNYHAWANRQAVLCNEALNTDMQFWKSEMNYVCGLLNRDVFNNSAWTQRALGLKFMEDSELEMEVDFTFEILKTAPHSAAAWNYLRFLVLDNDERHIKRLKEVIQFCHEILKNNDVCVPCLEVLGEVYYVLAVSSEQNGKNPNFRQNCKESAINIWTNCVKIDPIRTSYYKSRISHFCKLVDNS